MRDRALKLAPSTIGAVLEEKFSEDELKQLVAWLESPVNKKYQQLGAEMQNAFAQKLRRRSRPAGRAEAAGARRQDPRDPRRRRRRRRRGRGAGPGPAATARRRGRRAKQHARAWPHRLTAPREPPTSSSLREQIDALDRELLGAAEPPRRSRRTSAS